MIIRTPRYFYSFKCVADKCSASCCVGWDVYVDESTERKYIDLQGELGERIRKSLKHSPDGTCIGLSEGRCPFLNDRGLCDIISELGADYISEICAEHPRYYLTLGEYVFGGLGASCEEAARLILTEEGGHGYVEKEADGFLPLDCDGDIFNYVYRSYLECVGIASDESDLYSAIIKICGVTERLDGEINGDFSEKILHVPGDTADNYRFIREIAGSLEYMNEKSRDELFSRDLEKTCYEGSRTHGKKVLLYFLDRYYMMIAEDGDALGILGFILFSTAVIFRRLSGELRSDVSVFREYSSEIEYNECNVEAIREKTRSRIYTDVLPMFSL